MPDDPTASASPKERPIIEEPLIEEPIEKPKIMPILNLSDENALRSAAATPIQVGREGGWLRLREIGEHRDDGIRGRCGRLGNSSVGSVRPMRHFAPERM